MTGRFALYFAPKPQSDLWGRACRWLGRGDGEGAMVTGHAPAGLDADIFTQLTRSARRYGFHATLKPPMRLASGKDMDMFLAAARHFANGEAPVELGQMQIGLLEGFCAITPCHQGRELADFAARCVSAFEDFRAPSLPAEIAKRRANGLSERQDALLEAFGYPYVMDEFRFHLTLSDHLPGWAAHDTVEAARTHFAEDLDHPWVLDGISIFHEPEPGAAFERIADFPLSAQKGN